MWFTGVDTEAPTVGEEGAVRDVIYDDHFQALVIFFNMTDKVSGIRVMEIGLGRTKHDVEIRVYEPLEMNDRLRENMIVGLMGVTLEDGIPTWPRLRATDGGK